MRTCPNCHTTRAHFVVGGRVQCAVCSHTFEGASMSCPACNRPYEESRKVVTLDRDAVLTPRPDGSVLVEFVKGRGGEVLTDDQRRMITVILGSFRFNKDKMIWENYLMPTQMADVRRVLGDLFPIRLPS